MAQNDLFVENGSGLSVRNAINDALAAIASNYSGTTAPVFGATVNNQAPTSPATYQFWVDTAPTANNPSEPAILKIYDGTNWIKLRSVQVTDVDVNSEGNFVHTLGTNNVFQIVGSSAVQIPSGTTAQRPTANASDDIGLLRFNTQTQNVEVYTGTGNSWQNAVSVSVGTNSVSTSSIQDNAVTLSKLAPDAKTILNKGYRFGNNRGNTFTFSPSQVGHAASIDSGKYNVTLAQHAVTNISNDPGGAIWNGEWGFGNRHICSGYSGYGKHFLITESGKAFCWGTSQASYNNNSLPIGQDITTKKPHLCLTRITQGLFAANQEYSSVSLTRFTPHIDTADIVNRNTFFDFDGQPTYGNKPTAEAPGQIGPYTPRIRDINSNHFETWAITEDLRLLYCGNNASGGYGAGHNSAMELGTWQVVKFWIKNASTGIYERLPDNADTRIFMHASNMDGASRLTAITYYTHDAYITNYAIDMDGFLYSWGYNGTGALGDSTAPVTYLGADADNFKAKRLDFEFSSGGVHAGTTEKPGGVAYVHAAGGYYGYVYAIDYLGRVWAWGDNTNGQLGIGNTTAQNTPICLNTITGHPFSDKKIVHVITSGQEYGNNYAKTFFLTSEGKIYVAGYSEEFGAYTGKYSTTATETYMTPVLIDNDDYSMYQNVRAGASNAQDALKCVQLFVVGQRYTSLYAVMRVDDSDSDGGATYPQVWSWGNNHYGQLGRNATTGQAGVPTAVSKGDWFPLPIRFRLYGKQEEVTASGGAAPADGGPHRLQDYDTDLPYAQAIDTDFPVMRWPAAIYGQGNGNAAAALDKRGFVVLQDDQGKLFVTGGSSAGQTVSLLANTTLYDKNEYYETAITDNFITSFSPVYIQPEPCKEFSFINDSTHGNIQAMMIGESGQAYCIGQAGDTCFPFRDQANELFTPVPLFS